ncbi:DUF417 family protein [Hymenobacter terrenus]|uniref:DUF417 family protein n=1 Tax=Hymenobacter terrenus TaxID=1629124 RepID=UPI000AB77B6C|nr:DUF417 family protein [Hymenobacter terrenus]
MNSSALDQPTRFVAPPAANPSRSSLAPISALEQTGVFVLRYSIVLIVLWFGIFKFTPTEAAAIQPLFTHSPRFAWIYDVFRVRVVSNLVGGAEIVFALLIALRPVAPHLSFYGSLGAVLMFLTTLSFLLTTPGSLALVDGLWVPGVAFVSRT